MSSTTYTAWATTTETMPEADPGIGITDDGGRIDDRWSITDWTEWDEDAADDELARMGWTRVGQWIESGGQMAAQVKRV